MKLFPLLILAVFASKNKDNAVNGSENGEEFENNSIVVKIEEENYAKVNKKSKFIGVSFNEKTSKWRVQRYSKYENKAVYNGYHGDEEKAARASDTLARKLMRNGEQKLILNFPDDHTEVYTEEKKIKFIGVSYDKAKSKWKVQRRNKNEYKNVYNGYYDNEETAVHASDTLARKLMKNGEQNHKLNFPGDHTEVYPKTDKALSSQYIGVFNGKIKASNGHLKWIVRRWSKTENKLVTNGCYDDEETAAHASDTLARKLMENGEQKLKLNFLDDHTEVYPEKNQKNKRKRQNE